ncbi:MAG: hypothetical protein ACEQSQ_06005 [Candidatus Paceibacteria bacterium]
METYIVKKKDEKLLLFKEDKEIGQISPDATWVKDGDEFDEDKIEQVTTTYSWEDTDDATFRFQQFFDKSLSKTSTYWKVDFRYENKSEGDTVTFRVFKKIYKIKGPCGHFH